MTYDPKPMRELLAVPVTDDGAFEMLLELKPVVAAMLDDLAAKDAALKAAQEDNWNASIADAMNAWARGLGVPEFRGEWTGERVCQYIRDFHGQSNAKWYDRLDAKDAEIARLREVHAKFVRDELNFAKDVHTRLTGRLQIDQMAGVEMVRDWVSFLGSASKPTMPEGLASALDPSKDVPGFSLDTGRGGGEVAPNPVGPPASKPATEGGGK